MAALTKMGPKHQKGPQSVYKIGNCLKNGIMSVKRVHFLNILGPLGPSREIKLLGPERDRYSGPFRFLQLCEKCASHGLFPAVKAASQILATRYVLRSGR